MPVKRQISEVISEALSNLNQGNIESVRDNLEFMKTISFPSSSSSRSKSEISINDGTKRRNKSAYGNFMKMGLKDNSLISSGIPRKERMGYVARKWSGLSNEEKQKYDEKISDDEMIESQSKKMRCDGGINEYDSDSDEE